MSLDGLLVHVLVVCIEYLAWCEVLVQEILVIQLTQEVHKALEVWMLFPSQYFEWCCFAEVEIECETLERYDSCSLSSCDSWDRLFFFGTCWHSIVECKHLSVRVDSTCLVYDLRIQCRWITLELGFFKDLMYSHCKFDSTTEPKLWLCAYVTIHNLAHLLAESQSNAVPIRIELLASLTCHERGTIE